MNEGADDAEVRELCRHAMYRTIRMFFNGKDTPKKDLFVFLKNEI